MANSTFTVDSTLAWIYAYVAGRLTKGVGGDPQQPGLRSANFVKQTILGPPFKWPWNRNVLTFTTVAGQTDYTVSAATWGFIEKATFGNGTMVPPVMELQAKNILAADGKQGQPVDICPLIEDGNGNIVFRIFPAPDDIYTVTVTFQNAAALIPSTASSWGPIPDRYAYLADRGLLALMQSTYDMSLGQANWAMFLNSLVAASDSLTEQEKNLFLLERMRLAGSK